MHILLNVHNNVLTDICNTGIDYPSWIQAIMSVVTVILGVITIIIGANYITTRRNNARFGFYCNLLVHIERIEELLTDYDGLTEYLVDEDVRNEHLPSAMPKERADCVIPLFTALCDDFLDFISNSSDNVPPKNSIFNKKESWNKWYDNILVLVNYTQKCKLIKDDITLYLSKEKLEKYDTDKKEFLNALKYISGEIKKNLRY